MGRSTGCTDLQAIETEEIIEFYEWLQGISCPDKFNLPLGCKLTPDQAFRVIYFLQEYMEILPDNIEQCKKCKILFDIDYGGIIVDEDTEFYRDIKCEEKINIDEKWYGLYCEDCINLEEIQGENI